MAAIPASPFTLTTSRGFNDWLAAAGGSIAFTTYQAGKVFFLGLKPDGSLSVFERSFPRAMGLGVSADGQTLVLATQVQLYRFDNILPPGQRQDAFDAIFAPHQSWITGDLDIHDLVIGAESSPIFANTQFNCIATTSAGHSFRPLWRPPFISRLVAEDRCHLNGLATEAGRPRYVTCVSRSDVLDGWRDRRAKGGVVVEVPSGEIVAEGLSMPHSPRLVGRRLWLLNSGSGELGTVDLATGRFDPVCFCPGFARGLAFAGRFAIVGLSRVRANRTFQDLDLDAAFRKHDAEPRSGLLVVDTISGESVAWVRIEGVVEELFDIAWLPDVHCPSAIGLKSPEIRHVIAIDPA